MVVKPLVGHFSAETAYFVNDYPYGGLRTTIRFWLEQDRKKGFRFVSQTLNPKTQFWNKPKKSTYCLLAGAMYLDENEHCVWSGLTEYSSAAEVLRFLETFKQFKDDRVMAWVIAKMALCNRKIAGHPVVVVNNNDKVSDLEMQEAKEELEIWRKSLDLLKKNSTV